MAPDAYIRDAAQGHKHTHTVILLHGRDSQAEEFANEIFESEVSTNTVNQVHDRTLPAIFPTFRWVFPKAPVLCSLRFGVNMSQWFDMWSVEDPEEQAELQSDGLSQSTQGILEIIKTEEIFVPRNRIFLGGISQGFATALVTFLVEGQGGFAGLIGLCSWLPFASNIEDQISTRSSSEEDHQSQDSTFAALRAIFLSEVDNNRLWQPQSLSHIKQTSIFLGHSLDDGVVPIENARRMSGILTNLGLSVEWRIYADGGHWLNEPQGVDDVVSFINRCSRDVA